MKTLSLLIVLFISLLVAKLAHAEDIPASQYCSGTLGDDPSQSQLDAMADCESYVNSQTYGLFFTHPNTWGDTVYRGYYCRVDLYPEITGIYRSDNQAFCSTGPAECSIPEGQVQGLTTNYRISQVCYDNCIFDKPKKTICIFLNDGTSRCLSDYTSTGEYCDDEDGVSSAPFADYLDEEGCYNATDGERYCQSPNDSECPNYTVIDGQKYCRQEAEEDFDSDGDGIPDSEDPTPDNPNGDADGDGLPDADDPDPNNTDTDGDGIPDGEDEDPDGDGEPGYSGDNGDDEPREGITEGECNPETNINAPTCDKDLDGIQCHIYLNNWQARCEETQRHYELYGTPEDQQEYAEKGAEFLDPENPQNRLPGLDENGQYGPNDTVVNFADVTSNIDDTGFIAGSCPSDISYSVFGNTFSLSYQPICQLLQTINPVIVALGWFSAALIIGRSVTAGG